MFFDNLQTQVEFESDASTMFLLERTSDSISMMQTLATTFRSELSRDFLALIGSDHKISLLNHSLVADVFAVLANRVSAGGNLEKEHTSGSLLASSMLSFVFMGSAAMPESSTISLARRHIFTRYVSSIWSTSASPSSSDISFAFSACGDRKKNVKLSSLVAYFGIPKEDPHHG
jgi:hypothetical protein